MLLILTAKAVIALKPRSLLFSQSNGEPASRVTLFSMSMLYSKLLRKTGTIVYVNHVAIWSNPWRHMAVHEGVLYKGDNKADIA